MKRLLLCLTGLVVLTGCGTATAHEEPLASNAPPSAPPTARTEEAAPVRAAPPRVPTRLRLGDINAPIVPLSLTDTALTPPDDPRVLGWWGKRAGSRRGTTLLTGHTVHDGGGTFDNLEDTRVGTHARLNGHAYEVTSVEVISKSELARRAPDLFSQEGRPKLVLVTCEDYDRATGHYSSNVVVTLSPEERPSTDSAATMGGGGST
jgi:hypothetical protein